MKISSFAGLTSEDVSPFIIEVCGDHDQSLLDLFSCCADSVLCQLSLHLALNCLRIKISFDTPNAMLPIPQISHSVRIILLNTFRNYSCVLACFSCSVLRGSIILSFEMNRYQESSCSNILFVFCQVPNPLAMALLRWPLHIKQYHSYDNKTKRTSFSRSKVIDEKIWENSESVICIINPIVYDK